jgi:hypothetical protein
MAFEKIRWIVNRLRLAIGLEHRCTYRLYDFVTVHAPDEGYIGRVITAWTYTCKCGREIVEIDSAGIELLTHGHPYDEIVGIGEYQNNRLLGGRDERLQQKEKGMADETSVRR